MFRSALRLTAKSACTLRIASPPIVTRRYLSTAPPHQKSRSWKSSVARWSLAGAVVYYYNTATLFADEASDVAHVVPELSRSTETYETVEGVTQQRRALAQAQARAQAQAETQIQPDTPSSNLSAAPDGALSAADASEDLEAEAGQQGAFNEETGEINWDCPCLGGMANGPCGEQFRTAFSCFVFSKEDPKGVDCIEHFRAMQNCFREHPDIYGAELEDDEEGMPISGEQHATSGSYDPDPTATSARTLSADHGEKFPTQHNTLPDSQDAIQGKRPREEMVKEQVRSSVPEAVDEAPTVVPKSAHDAR